MPSRWRIDDEVAVAVVAADRLHAAAARRHDRRAGRGREVQAGVEHAPARAEAVAERDAERREEAQDRARRRAPERGERGRAGDAVGAEPGPGLEAPQRGSGARAEAAVDRAGREAVAGEQELQGGDVPAARARVLSGREPSRGRPRRPSARRVRGPAMPSTTSPRRACSVRTAARVPGPATPSTLPP